MYPSIRSLPAAIHPLVHTPSRRVSLSVRPSSQRSDRLTKNGQHSFNLGGKRLRWGLGMGGGGVEAGMGVDWFYCTIVQSSGFHQPVKEEPYP